MVLEIAYHCPRSPTRDIASTGRRKHIRVSESLEETIFICSYHFGFPTVLETRVFQLEDALSRAVTVAQVVRGTKSWPPVRSLLGRALSGAAMPTTRTTPCVEYQNLKKKKKKSITSEYTIFGRRYTPGLKLEFIGQRVQTNI